MDGTVWKLRLDGLSRLFLAPDDRPALCVRQARAKKGGRLNRFGEVSFEPYEYILELSDQETERQLNTSLLVVSKIIVNELTSRRNG